VATRSASWSPPAERGRVAIAAAGAICVFAASWGALHLHAYSHFQIRDTPVYQAYGEAMASGKVPYRDFSVEYPPGALPAFLLPAIGPSSKGTYETRFDLLMLLCGIGALAAMAVVLRALRAIPVHLVGALGTAALAPLALGSVLLSRYDLLPAALTVGALAALCTGRQRLSLGVLGLAIATKVYPGVLAPLFLAHVWRRHGRRETLVCAAVLAGVVAAVFAPFVALSPGGVWDSFVGQTTRPLQIESLGSGILFAAHNAFGLGLPIDSSHGSQNLAGSLPDAIGAVQTVLQIGAVVAIWAWFARRPRADEELVRASAAAVCAFVALGKVLSPQFLIWLLPLVPLVSGRRAPRVAALLAATLVLTQLWFPTSYWGIVFGLSPYGSTLVLVRDLVLLGLLAALVWPEREPARVSSPARVPARTP
jgi:Glycosyltransferase family 87